MMTPPEPELRPLSQRWMLEFQTGAMWRVTDETTQDYLLLPQHLTLEPPPHSDFELFGLHMTLGVYVRFLGDVVVEGPESYYIGMNFGPTLEIWSADEKTSFYFRPGGGAGLVDSTDEPGGQGQDFTLNWVLEAGVRRQIGENVTLSLGVYFQHMSNLGMSDPNPGLDALGPVLGVGWQF